MTDLVIRNLQRTFKINKPLLIRVVRKLLEITEFSPANLSIVFVNNKKIVELNKRFHSTVAPTDVLTFDYKLENRTCEIIISVEMASTNAPRYQSIIERELLLYIIHGILHLIGYTDDTTKKRLQMTNKQNRLLNVLTSDFDLTNIVYYTGRSANTLTHRLRNSSIAIR